MADRGAAVEVHGAVAVDGTVAKKDPDVLVAQIERTREDLARTIDSLAERVSPANNLRMLGDTVRQRVSQQAARPEVQIGAAAVGAVIIGLTILRARHRSR